MVVHDPAARADTSPLLSVAELPTPVPGEDGVLVSVSVCAVCRTDLDVAQGRLPAARYPVIPGHQIIGTVAAVGRNVRERREGDRIGVAWINWADGTCRWCARGEENLCPAFRSTGCDANGGDHGGGGGAPPSP